jgi:hypothetical protein
MADAEYLIVKHLSRKDITRLFAQIQINPETDCWEWTGKTTRGYGYTSVHSETQFVHRLFWAWLIGPLPRRKAGKKTPNLDHRVCDNKRCANPAHLELVSPKENILRSNAPPALNARRVMCSRGHMLPSGPGKRQCKICRRLSEQTESRKAARQVYLDSHVEERRKAQREHRRRYRQGPMREHLLMKAREYDRKRRPRGRRAK